MLVTLRCFIICLLFKFMKAQYEKATRFSDTGKCPYVSQWNERAEDFCRDKFGFDHDARTRYHCLEKQSGGYVELCINPMNVKEGHYPKWSSHNDPPRMYLVECPPGSYQPYERWSNEFNKCKMKSNCSEKIGQLYSWCPDGGTLDDLQCRCDFQRGYVSNLYAFHNPLNKSCFTPSRENSACSMYSCGGNKELDRAYRCVQKCPKNWHRPPEDLECKPNNREPVFSSSTTTTSLYSTNGKGSSVPTLINIGRREERTFTAIIVLSIVIVVVIIIIIVIIIAVFFLRKRKPTDDMSVLYRRAEGTVQMHGLYEETIPISRSTRNNPEASSSAFYSITVKELHINNTNIGNIDYAIVGDKATMVVNNSTQNEDE